MPIKGLAELQRKLDSLPDKVKLRIRAAMEVGAEEIVALAKSLVVVDDGDLKDSIGWTWGRVPKGAMTLGVVQSLGGDLTITIFAGDDKAFYARWVEFGTAPHNTAKGGGNKSFKGAANAHPGTKAQPFFYVSYRALRKRTASRMTRAINKAAKEVAAGG